MMRNIKSTKSLTNLPKKGIPITVKSMISVLVICYLLMACIVLSSCNNKQEKDPNANPEVEVVTDTQDEMVALQETMTELGLSSGSCNIDNDPAPILRLGKYIDLGNGNYNIVPVADVSIKGGNVHIITHGWAPYYLAAVNDYKKNNPGHFLKAWYPEARETDSNGNPTGERYFVEKFIPLAQSILAADPGATVLCYSWIDHSATDGITNAYLSENCTGPMGATMFLAIQKAIDSKYNRKLHLLGHSHGTRVVSVAGILEKRIDDNQTIQLTLFDSPERAPQNSADNHLGKILPQFAPNRTNRFIENYISYYGACYNDDPGLNSIVDITLRPSYHGCWNNSIEGCVTCAHEYGVTWYTNATNAHGGYGLGWSPLINPSIAPTLPNDFLQQKHNTNIAKTVGCQQGVIWSCASLFEENVDRVKPEL